MKKHLKSLTSRKRSAGILVVAFALIGISLLVFTKAAVGTAALTLSPTSGSYNINSNFTVDIYVNSSATDPVASVEVQLSYDAAKLQYVSIEPTGGAFPDCFGKTGGGGTASMSCLKAGAPFPTGSQKVGTVTFKALAGNGTTSVSFAANSHVWKADGIPTELWNGVTTGGTYTLVTPDTTPPTVSIVSPVSGATVGATTTINANATDSGGGTVTKVEFYVNGALKGTDTSSPYSYSWDTTTIGDGTYPLTAKAYDNAATPNVGTSLPVSAVVFNSKPDLVVSSISVTPSTLKVGDSVTLSAVITNNGNAPTTAGVINTTTFTVDSTVVSSPTDSSALAVGASRTITATVPWTATLGSHTVAVTTDKNNLITESNEANNASSKSILVYKPGDANNDGSIGSADLAIIAFNWGKTSMTFDKGDFSGNGTIGSEDLAIIAFNWGR